MSTKGIRATRFVLEDKNGNMRATLAALKDGPALRLCDKSGQYGQSVE
ncbi:MAG TPA: hypothetical protein VJJ98_07405 [Sedimentisphaerales bacterium]|nr:hypothetical protein [Sedimentisphaerales bacterium]